MSGAGWLVFGLAVLLLVLSDLRRCVDRLVGPPDIRWKLRIPGAPRRHRQTQCWHIATGSRRRAVATLLLLSTPTRPARQDRALLRSSEWL